MKYLLAKAQLFMDKFRSYKLPDNIPKDSKSFVRYAIIPVERGLNLIRSNPYNYFDWHIGKLRVIYSNSDRKLNINGYKIKISSKRLQCFLEKGLTCNFCSKKASYFVLEKLKKDELDLSISPHLNAYHLSDDGIETLMTCDHIIPLSKNGKNYIDNMQTLCYPCNNKKGDKMPDELQKELGALCENKGNYD
jgi:5-methylcytosine-specific restriction endonuclease McrA